MKGETGAVGPQGSVGPKGDTGAAGPQGLQGPKGETGAVGPQGLQGAKGDIGDKGEKGEPGSNTSVMQRFVGQGKTGGQTGGLGGQTTNNGRQTLPGASLTALVPVANMYLPAGDYVLNANVDVAPTLPTAQQYTCELTVANEVDPVDDLPIIYAVQTRLSLSSVVHIYIPSKVTVSCGSDAPAIVLKARLTALHIDRIEPAVAGN